MIIKLAQHFLDVRQIHNSELQATIIYIIKKQCYKSKNKNPVYRRFICGPFFPKTPVHSLSISGLLIIFRKFIICPMETVLMTESGLYRECFLVLISSSSERFSCYQPLSYIKHQIDLVRCRSLEFCVYICFHQSESSVV